MKIKIVCDRKKFFQIKKDLIFNFDGNIEIITSDHSSEGMEIDETFDLLLIDHVMVDIETIRRIKIDYPRCKIVTLEDNDGSESPIISVFSINKN